MQRRIAMKHLRWLLAVAVLLVKVPLPFGTAQEQKPVNQLMIKKLEQAQKVLAGIALNDFDKIDSGASALLQISKEAEWKVLKTPQYEVFSNDLRKAAEAMSQHAKTKNLDGATLAYVDLTLTCVKCHKHVREVRMARAD